MATPNAALPQSDRAAAFGVFVGAVVIVGVVEPPRWVEAVAALAGVVALAVAKVTGMERVTEVDDQTETAQFSPMAIPNSASLGVSKRYITSSSTLAEMTYRQPRYHCNWTPSSLGTAYLLHRICRRQAQGRHTSEVMCCNQARMSTA
jgi:hypothetical protein